METVWERTWALKTRDSAYLMLSTSATVDEPNGARDRMNGLSKHRNVHRVANELKTWR